LPLPFPPPPPCSRPPFFVGRVSILVPSGPTPSFFFPQNRTLFFFFYLLPFPLISKCGKNGLPFPPLYSRGERFFLSSAGSLSYLPPEIVLPPSFFLKRPVAIFPLFFTPCLHIFFFLRCPFSPFPLFLYAELYLFPSPFPPPLFLPPFPPELLP